MSRRAPAAAASRAARSRFDRSLTWACDEPHLVRVELSGADPSPAAILGGGGLRHPAALRRRDRRRHVSSGYGAARLGSRTVARRLCPAVAPADRWALWREPQPAPALLPAPGDSEA